MSKKSQEKRMKRTKTKRDDDALETKKQKWQYDDMKAMRDSARIDAKRIRGTWGIL